MTTTCDLSAPGETWLPAAVPPEPAGLRASLQALALDHPAAAVGAAADRVAGALAEAAAGEVVCLCIGPAALRSAARSYKREIWLWVMGERRWEQTAESIVGRAARRATAA